MAPCAEVVGSVPRPDCRPDTHTASVPGHETPACNADVWCCVQRLLNLSQDQIADLMCIRQVCLVKRHLIAAEHSAIMSSIQSQCPSLDITAAMPCDSSQGMARLAEKLQQNRAADAQVVHRVSRALFLGVSCLYRCLPSWPSGACLA